MNIPRSCGLLLHITSLPGPHGIGTLGEEAFRFVDLLATGRQQYWQILPIGPVSPFLDYCPYASTSTFAGNYLFISLERLCQSNWCSQDIASVPQADGNFIDFDSVADRNLSILKTACDDFFNQAPDSELRDFEDFCHDSTYWLDDYSLFASLAEHFKTNNWHSWPLDISFRLPSAIETWHRKLAGSIRFQKFVQFIFYSQWDAFKTYCNNHGVSLIGDIPIYITLAGADAWSHPDIFQLDTETRLPDAVSGVPPDYFSKTGQRWGNPLYRWWDARNQLHAGTCAWWAERVAHLRKLVDIIRIDHFRGFESYWAIPSHEGTAVNGKWQKGPGLLFFQRLRDDVGDLPLIAEDLGIITPEVEKLRADTGLPGMKVLQFAFDGKNSNPYLPHNFTSDNCIVYTGTHDNNTTNGWFYGPENNKANQQYILRYLGGNGFSNFHLHLNRIAYRSTARLVILPVQDVLGYGAEFRLNTPGTRRGNWQWKLTEHALTEQHMLQLADMAHMYRRTPSGESA